MYPFKPLILTCLLYLSATWNAFGQLSTADIDNDGIIDSLWYSFTDTILTIKLSSKDFQPISQTYAVIDEYDDWGIVEARDGGISIRLYHTRTSTHYDYTYEESTGKFLLSNVFHENNHYGVMSVSLDDGIFYGEMHSWSQFTEPDSIRSYPLIHFPVHYESIYLGDEKPDFISKGYRLLDTLEEIYTPSTIDTVRFVNHICEYDEYDPSPWEYCDILYVDKNGKKRYVLDVSEEWPIRDDLIQITWGYAFCHYPKEDSYLVLPAITDVRIVEPGRVSQFYDNNQKRINLHDNAGWAESTGELIDYGVDYFFIVTEEKKIKKFMNEPGSLEVDYFQVEKERLWRNEWQYGIVMDIFNEYNGKKKFIEKVVLGITRDQDFLYYLYKDKTGELIPLPYPDF